MYVSYTIYPEVYDPARGRRPPLVGMTIKPLPSVTREEVEALIAELQTISAKMASGS